MYAEGRGVAKDDAKAFDWLRRAIHSHTEARFLCATIYANGRGIRKDEITAYALFSLAAIQNRGGAAEARDDLGKRLTEDQREQASELITFWGGNAFLEE